MSDLKIGDKAPDFDLPRDGSGNISLSNLEGKKVIVYFYPKDDTSGCTNEAQQFSALVADFEAANTIVLGISKDSVKSHDKFKTKYGLEITLLSDEELIAANAYGVWVEKSMYGRKYMGLERATYLIDESGIISKIWRKVKVTGHASEVLAACQ